MPFISMNCNDVIRNSLVWILNLPFLGSVVKDLHLWGTSLFQFNLLILIWPNAKIGTTRVVSSCYSKVYFTTEILSVRIPKCEKTIFMKETSGPGPEHSHDQDKKVRI